MHTFGCKVNTYDSGLMQSNMSNSGYVLVDKRSIKPKIHVLNTCAVTAEATKEAVRLIRKIKSKEPFSTVVVTGCAAQVDTGSFENLNGVDLVVANSHKGLLPEIISQYFKGNIQNKVFKANIFRKEDLEVGGGQEKDHTRSFLKIQDGCNSFCSYCIIPYARGKSRSIPADVLIKKINELQRLGYHEVVLTGVHIGDYEDKESSCANLTELVERILKKTQGIRFRLSSLEPVELNKDLLNLYDDPRMCPHFHMSVQSVDTYVLKSMKRKYTEEDVVGIFNQIREKLPHAFIGMDVIVGFPGETPEMFENTYKNLAESPWTRIHVFPYSERQGTKAVIMDGSIPWAVRLDRAKKLRELSLHRYQSEALKMINKSAEVLILKKSAKGAHGLTDNYWPVSFKDEEAISNYKGKLVKTVITGLQEPSVQNAEGVLIAGEVEA